MDRSLRASSASNHEMRPVSGEDLVTAALQSSLARAQKNYKLFTHKKLSPGESLKTKQSRGNGLGVGEKAQAFKFQSEFDLWVEQATEFTFVSEGYTNGATVPKDIECLNSHYVTGRKLKVKKKSTPEPALLKRNGEGESTFGSTASLESDGKNKPRESILKGKDKLKTAAATENSFDILQKLKESRKEKKRLLKLKKKLLKKGHSVEEAENLVQQSPGSSVGAILKQLEVKSVKTTGREESLLKQQQLAKNNNKRIKMKDLENGESSASVAGPATPPTQASFSTSQTMNGGCSSSGYSSGSSSSGSNSSSSPSQGHQLPKPKRVLYPREKIQPGYTEKLPVGTGFYNMGNSCYLNASLQAVFHVPAFINWLRQDVEHRKQCQDNNNCIICAMKKTLDSAMSRHNTATAIRPVEIINRLRSICRHFSHGRQEDAHEFLRYLFESMERSYLSAINGLRLDNRTKETNPLGQIFGGYLRTEVTCLKCHYVSTTFQPTAELQLDIRHVTTLEDAIMNHFKKERLDNNDYKCEKCRTISQATKQFSLEVPPIVLCLQLKRFTLYGTKIAKRIHCNRSLNMSKYMHKSKQVNGFTDLRYRLVALVTHLGSSPNCGHYTAIAEAANGNFYQFDDSFVHQVTAANALNNDAYVIIYEMDKRTHKPAEPSSSTSSSSYTTNMTNLFPSSIITSSSSSSNTQTLFPKKLPSTPIPKVPSFQSKFSSEQESKKESIPNGIISSSEKVNGNSSNNITNGSKGLCLDRKLISFGLSSSNGSNPKRINILKPGASLTNSSKLGIQSNGNSATNSAVASSSPLTKEKCDQTIKLVPYNDDEESDKDDGRVLNGKRLKSPEKQSPARNPELPVTPPKSPKSANSSSTVSGVSALAENTTPVKGNCSPKLSGESMGTPKLENNVLKDIVKRKAPSEEETPRKSRPPRRRRSSSTSSTSSNSSTTSSDSKSKKSNESKRKREEFSSDSRRDRDHNHRESYSQERDRERRRDRNPSRSPSVDAEKDNKRESSNDKKRSESAATGGGFDVARLKPENSIVGWDGQKSNLSRSFDEDRKRSNDKSLDEEYDDEFDQGRTKKVRRSRSLPRESEVGYAGNRFQNVEDRKKQVEAWSNIMNMGSKNSGGNAGTGCKSWTNEDDSSRQRKNFTPRPSSSNGGIGSRPRHSSSNSSSNYQRSHGRSPYRNGHHSSNGGSGNGNHHRSQHHYNNNSTNKHWSSNNDRNRH